MILSARMAELGISPELVALAEQLEEQAEDLERLTRARGGLNLTNAAKVLGRKPKFLIGWLMSHNWIFREGDRLCAVQAKLEAGLVKQKIMRLYRVDGSETFGIQVFITAKGLARLTREFPEGPIREGVDDGRTT